MTIKERLFNSTTLNKSNIKGKLLSRSLLWMGFGLAFIILVAYLSMSVPAFKTSIIRVFTSSTWIFISLMNIGLLFGIFFSIRNMKTSLLFLVILYAIFAFFQGVYIAGLLLFTGMEKMSQVLLLMLVPASIFVIMGLLAYSNFIDFTKLIPYTIFALFGLLIMSLILIFVQSAMAQRWYLLLAAALFIIWIGIDIQIIQRTEQSLEFTNIDKAEMNRLALMFGLQLFIDFVNLLIILIRLVGSSFID